MWWRLQSGIAAHLLHFTACVFPPLPRHVLGIKAVFYCKTVKMKHLQPLLHSASDPSISVIWLVPAPEVSLGKETSAAANRMQMDCH